MAPSTITKKGIIDFLWEWAQSNGDWGKLLVSKIIIGEDGLTEAEATEVFDYYLQSIGLKSGLPALTITKPAYKASTKKIDIISLTDVKGVNRLAPGQTISFEKNMTVVYGENGSGKTGYGRILKALGQSYEVANRILGDVNKPKEAFNATINYQVDGKDETFSWDGTCSNIDLQSISVFNNNCVQISLTDGRGLLVSPIGFHLFNLITEELSYLSDLLQKTIDKHPTQFNWNTILHTGTPQEIYITNLKGNSSIPKLIELSTFSLEHEKQLSDKELELKNLNKLLLETELLGFRAQVNELDSIVAKIKKSELLLNSESWTKIINYNKQIKELESKTKTGLKEIAEANNIQVYQSKEFKSFIEAADAYLKVIDKPDYPNAVDEVCVYCQQELSDQKAKNLLSSYKQLLNDNSQELLAKAKQVKGQLVNQIAQVEIPLVFHQKTFGSDEKQNSIQPIEIITYNKELGELKSSIVDDSVQEQTAFTFDYKKHIVNFEGKKTKIVLIISDKQLLLDNLSKRETEIQSVISELKDRQFLFSKVEEIKTAIANKSIVSKLLTNKSAFSTNSISRKTSEARDELVQQNFNSIFQNELKAFRKSTIQIDLSFGTVKGQSKIQQKLKSHLLSEILSEGEQKAIALAEFITELQLDNSQSPVIFDDPVNSLDHHIIEDVSRRLLKLSRDRQVVIFTHSVLLFNSIMSLSDIQTFKDIKCKLYDIRSEYGITGIISDAEEDIDKVKVYTTKINVLLNNTPKDRLESDVASDGYGYLRSAIELCVEYNIFKGTVKRYQKNIALTNFLKVDGVLINQNKDTLNEVFERCCGYIKGHSSPDEVQTMPTMVQLKNDFQIFNSILQQFPLN